MDKEIRTIYTCMFFLCLFISGAMLISFDAKDRVLALEKRVTQLEVR